MDYRQLSDTLVKVAKEYMADNHYAIECMNEATMVNELGTLGVDARDLVPILIAWGIEKTDPEERNKEIKEKLLQLRDAFKDPDHSARKKYLDMIYDLRDNLNPDQIDMNNESDVRRLMQCMLLSQTFAKKLEENPDYFNSRYSDPNERRLMDAKNIYYEKVVMYARHHLAQPNFDGKKLEINPGLITFKSPLSYTNQEVYDCSADFAKLRLDTVQEEISQGRQPSNVYEIPILDSMIPHAGETVKKAAKHKNPYRTLSEEYSNFVIASSILPRTNKNMQGMLEGEFTDYFDSVYVDGKPFLTFIKEKFPKQRGTDDFLNFRTLSNLMLNPRHRVDVVHSYRDEQGVMQYEARTLRPSVTPEQEELYMKQFTWLRRALSERGWFRIKPLKEQIAQVKTDPDDPEVQACYASICADMKKEVEARIEAINQRKEQERQKELANVHTYDKEKDFMTRMVSMTVANYRRPELQPGAMLVMSNMVEKSCEELMDKLKESPTFESVAEILAKQVLFGQLTTARTTTQHKIGALENALIGDTDAATKAKIDIAVKIMAQDPALKENFFKMAGVADGENPVVDKAFMDKVYAAGGYRTLTKHYTAQKAAEKAQNMLIEGIQNQMSIQQQAPTNAPANAQPPQPDAPVPPQPKAPEQPSIGIG